MKKSNIIISILSILLLAGIIIRTNKDAANEYNINTISNKKLNEIVVGAFNKIEVSGGIAANISGGNTQKVMFFVNNGNKNAIPEIKVLDSTLYVVATKTEKSGKAFVSIKIPKISSVVAKNVNSLKIDSLNLDTLTIISTNSTIKTKQLNCKSLRLEITDSAYFKGDNSDIGLLTITAKSHSRVKIFNFSAKNLKCGFYDYSTLSVEGIIEKSNIFADSTSSCNKYHYPRK